MNEMWVSVPGGIRFKHSKAVLHRFTVGRLRVRVSVSFFLLHHPDGNTTTKIDWAFGPLEFDGIGDAGLGTLEESATAKFTLETGSLLPPRTELTVAGVIRRIKIKRLE